MNLLTATSLFLATRVHGLYVPAPEKSVMDAIHAIADKCVSGDVHDECKNYAIQAHASCGPYDVTCQADKVVEAYQFCHSLCQNAEYMSADTRSFLVDTRHNVPDVTVELYARRLASPKEKRSDPAEKPNAALLRDPQLGQYLDIPDDYTPYISSEDPNYSGDAYIPTSANSDAYSPADAYPSNDPYTIDQRYNGNQYDAVDSSVLATSDISRNRDNEWVTFYQDEDVPDAAAKPKAGYFGIRERVRNRLTIHTVKNKNSTAADNTTIASTTNRTRGSASPTAGSNSNAGVKNALPLMVLLPAAAMVLL